MAMDWLLTPLSDADPCGPDLDAADDAEFVDYYFDAESRLPERYFTPGMSDIGRDGREGTPDRLFDPASIDLARETAAITALLQRSRDLRLVSLLARFQILAGRVGEFADSVEAMAALLAAWPQQVNPTTADGMAERRHAVDSLANQTAVVSPLQHLKLLEQADVSLRHYLVATGQAEKRASEDVGEAGAMVSALRAPGHAAAVAGVHDALSRAARALTTIQTLLRQPEAGGISVDLSSPLDTIQEILALIVQARPDLGVSVAAPDATAQASNSKDDVLPQKAAKPAFVDIASRAEAKARLAAAEAWLAQAEPSSPALLLIVQARLLVGKSLTDALEVLLPNDAARATIAFSPETGFALAMDRLRELSAAIPQDPAAGSAPDSFALPPLRDRASLSAELAGIETWYQNAEPASPIPILLARARAFLDRGFDSILAEILPQKP